MTPEEFVESCVKEREYLFKAYMNKQSGSLVAQDISKLNLSDSQSIAIQNIVKDILNDVFYTLLLGLNGAASIGDKQLPYRLYDDAGNELTGELEDLAWKYFREES